MSHFVTMIIGENPEEQLEPFNENIEIYHHELDRYKEEFKKDGKKKSFAKYLEECYGFTKVNKGDTEPEGSYFIVDGRNKVLDVVVCYNPDAKWDWYELGGRWSGALLLKERGANGEERWTDQALKKNIDFEGMAANYVKEQSEGYDYIRKIIEPYLNETYLTFEQIRENEPDIEKARIKYHEQSVVKALYDNDVFIINIEDYLVAKDEYMGKQKFEGFYPFAFLKDGEWHEAGQMGWFACVSNRNENWNEEFDKLFAAVGDDELVSIYDCHI